MDTRPAKMRILSLLRNILPKAISMTLINEQITVGITGITTSVMTEYIQYVTPPCIMPNEITHGNITIASIKY